MQRDFHTGVDENVCQNGSFTYDSAISYDTAWSAGTVNVLKTEQKVRLNEPYEV